MGQRIDVNHENIYYGDFLAVEDVNINIEPNKVTAFIGPSGCGKSTVLRTLDRMHEIIPGAHVEGEVLLEGKNLYDKDVDPVAVRRDVGMDGAGDMHVRHGAQLCQSGPTPPNPFPSAGPTRAWGNPACGRTGR